MRPGGAAYTASRMEGRWRTPAVGVGCLVFREGSILLVRDRGGSQPGTWAPPGGHLEFGESPHACAARETLEETGIRVQRVEFVGITNDYFEEIGRHYVTIWMRAESLEGDAFAADAEEILEVGWFKRSRLPAPLLLSFSNLIGGRLLTGDEAAAQFASSATW